TGLLLLTALFFTFTYTTLHEGGHALAGLLFEGSIRRINVNFFDLSAHVVLDGPFTRAQDALIAISGWALPVILYLIFLAFTYKRTNPLLMMMRWIAGISLLGSSLPWIVIPVLYRFGNPPNDDVTNFLNLSGLPPLSVSAVFLLLVGAGVWLLIRGRGQIKLYLDWLRSTQPVLQQPAVLRGLAVMGLISLALIGLVGIINQGFGDSGSPDGYAQVVEEKLETADPDGAVIYTFEKADDGPLGVYLQAKNVHTDTIEVILRGPDGWAFILLQGKGYQASNYISNPAWGSLPARTYTVELAGSPARGTIVIYLKQ
ncbi:MAG: M50 family metallopeptidase, partial [Anaerolineaceae bacterium]